MEKICVFCGEKPEAKTNEHVLPRWLINLTGKPTRQARFGLRRVGDTVTERIFSFDSFKFPACDECNGEFKILEDQAKLAIEKLLLRDALAATDLSILLDWLDKVRIGIWLGYLYLNKSYGSVEPLYHIEQRVGLYDRCVGIFFSDETNEQLITVGVPTPSSTYTPSCFGLVINNIYLLNISYMFLLARRLGFPFPREVSYEPDSRLASCDEFEPGRERTMSPVIKKPFSLQGPLILQPMFRGELANDELRELYQTEYVRERSLDWTKGVGAIFLEQKDQISIYPANGTNDWIPNTIYAKMEIKNLFVKQVLNSQIMLERIIAE